MDCPTEYISNSPQDTFDIGKKIAQNLASGSIIALKGELGSGKTALTKGIAAGLGIKELITSPTYTIINEYLISEQAYCDRNDRNEQAGSSRSFGTEQLFYHIDTYRLNNEKEFEEIGGREILSSNGICIIEWADKIKNLLPENTIEINIIIIAGAESRKIAIKGLDSL